MINFGSTPQRSGTWTWFKPLITGKSLKVQYEEDAGVYTIFGYDLPEVCACTIWIGTVPPSVIAGGYSQAQNDADKTDFETNFKPYANRSIDDVPSRLFTTSIKNGGSANLSVDGSVTPVVFEANPPNNYDVQVTAFSFLFEGSTMAFGNRFVLNAITTLANGLLLEVKAADLSVTWQNMKRTRDLIEIADDFDLVAATTNFLKVNVHLPQALRLSRAGTFAQPDYLRITVRDNLTAFSFAEAFVQGVLI